LGADGGQDLPTGCNGDASLKISWVDAGRAGTV
jgi:hypothetical protein